MHTNATCPWPAALTRCTRLRRLALEEFSPVLPVNIGDLVRQITSSPLNSTRCCVFCEAPGCRPGTVIWHQASGTVENSMVTPP